MAAANIPTLQDAVSDDLNYQVWAPIVKRTLVEKGLWDVVENGIPPDPSKIPELAATIQAEDLSKWRDSVGKDVKALQILQSSLPDSVFRKTLEAASAKHLWDLLKESDEQAKLEKDICRMLERLEPVGTRSQSKEDSTKSKGKREECSQCGGRVRRNQQTTQESRDDEAVPEYVSYAMYVGDLTYDEDMWIIYTTTTNHMTPCEKHFTNLDRTRRARVTFIDGSSLMAQGTGDIRVLTREGRKKTIKNVLYVPGIVANALSVGQLSVSGYDVEMTLEKCTIRDRKSGTIFGQTRREENRGFCLRLQAY